MKEALKLAKSKNYEGAASAYGNIYAARGTFQALVTEALSLNDAIALMAELAQKTNNPLAAGMLANMGRASSSRQRAEEQLSDDRPLAEVAAEQASSELLAKLPQGSRISLFDNSRVKTALLDSVIGGIFDNLASNSKGITVLDRENQSLINLEKQYQASGEVSDDAAVSIGKSLGLTSIVTCSIEGDGHMRRLRIRAVDIETGAIIYTGSFEI
jgi:hypothetical protein